ncbi:MAG: hypothetical protein VX007_07155, partial [Pseudomonadota bacterium]|nr:hypothetical protein [Pseudomonadota bacterium]
SPGGRFPLFGVPGEIIAVTTSSRWREAEDRVVRTRRQKGGSARTLVSHFLLDILSGFFQCI